MARALFCRWIVVWFLLTTYWSATTANSLYYLSSVAEEGNFDAFGVYLYRQVWWNFPVRAADEVLGLSERWMDGYFSPEALATSPGLSALARCAGNIMIVDYAVGSCVWLALVAGLVAGASRLISRLTRG